MAVDVVRPSAESADLVLSVALPATPCHVRGDAERLQQALGNVLTNAVKFTPTGGIQVTLAGRDRRYEIHVADTGKASTDNFFRSSSSAFSRQSEAAGVMTDWALDCRFVAI